MYYRIALFILTFAFFEAKPQAGLSKKELLDILSKGVNDTILIDTYNELIWPIYSYDNADSSLYYGNKAVLLATKINDIKRLSIAHRRIGITYINMGDIKSSISHQEESFHLSEKINYKRGMQLALNNIGVAYLNNELLNKALTFFLKSLRIAEETKDYSAAAANLYINCGMIYLKTGDTLRSKEFYMKAKKLALQIKDNDLLVVCNSNLSTYFRNLNKTDSATYYLAEAKKYITDKTPTSTKFNYYLNEGLLYSFKGDHQKALEAFLNTVTYATIEADEITVTINIAVEYTKLKNSERALTYFDKAYNLSKKNKTYDNLEYISQAMAEIYEARNDFKNFAQMLKHHVAFQDSNARVNKVQQIFRQQLEFDYERKQVADSIRFEQKEHLKNIELEVAATKLNKEKSFRVMLFVLLIIIILFSAFIFNRFLLTRRQKKIIEHQKQIVEIKNHEILDSINYAKRLQTAILPQLPDIKKELNLDILYLPKDIIGGDFYFFEKHNGLIFMAVCDCTGHGIPGALMSVVCHHALQKSIKEFNLTTPNLILNKTKQIVMDSLNATNQNIKDGMDCSLLVIDKKKNKVLWAGANNPLWILSAEAIQEIKGDKQPVAFYENTKDFTNHEVEIKAGSFLYLLTDGYADQFGGLSAKKYKYKALKEFLISISNLAVEKQVELLHQNFLKWKGHLDQVDDVAIAVIKI